MGGFASARRSRCLAWVRWGRSSRKRPARPAHAWSRWTCWTRGSKWPSVSARPSRSTRKPNPSPRRSRTLPMVAARTAYSARVVTMGFFQGDAHGLFLGEEFHHNRVNVVGSQISGVDPELKYRWDKLRLQQTAVRLQVDGVLNLIPLITHRVSFDRAA